MSVLDLLVVYCGSGDLDITVEIAPDALRALCSEAIIAPICAVTTRSVRSRPEERTP